MISIAVDAMSGDFGPTVTVPACLRALSFMPDINLVLLGDTELIQSELAKQESKVSRDQLRIVHTTQLVGMEDKPAIALRTKKDSSMYHAIQLLRDGEVMAVVSAGNTGALLAIGCHLLQTFDGINRPAICAAIPAVDGHTFLLDVGANTDVSADGLHQFAIMGSVFASAMLGVEKPSVGLLNIGVENIKGNGLVKHASLLLQADEALNYQGFVEADHLFHGKYQVVVCDGFVGNIALKSSEGTAQLIALRLREMFSQGFLLRITGWLIQPVLARFRSSINPAKYNGASFLGLRSTLVKSHGGADTDAFLRAIEVARNEVKAGIPELIEKNLQKFLQA